MRRFKLTSAPLTTTSAPLAKTSAPLTKTSAPLTTTSAPLAKTAAPLTTAFVALVTALLALATLLAPSASADDGWEWEDRVADADAVSFRGAAFDTCNTPPLDTMRAWRKSSPYRGVGVYFAGRGRHCPVQKNLNESWVGQVHDMGWQVLPIFVGSQAPCVYAENKKKVKIGNQPAKQGRSEAEQAVQEAAHLGMREGSALYLDLEAYNANNAACARTVLDFVRAWNREVRELGYLPGFYSSAESGVRQIEQARVAGKSDLPAAIWFARWRSGPALYQEAALHRDAWQHRRIHQYAGNSAETHGGKRLVVDRNDVDAPVAYIG
ncbi:DUF1906 domain-containing protein [Streptomyces sp. NPDC006530]|uniref:DUF1906 domain-containing protein n=1 Tax=Streptomyces sp. NPDC006530 TaxID=3364750 RepID=UPI0036CCF5BC